MRRLKDSFQTNLDAKKSQDHDSESSLVDFLKSNYITISSKKLTLQKISLFEYYEKHHHLADFFTQLNLTKQLSENNEGLFLSFGCGLAEELYWLRHNLGPRLRYIGMDLNTNQDGVSLQRLSLLKKAYQEYKNVSFAQIDATNLDLVKEAIGTKKFADIILVRHPNFKINKDECPFNKMFCEIFPQICRPDGKTIIMVTSYYGDEIAQSIRYLRSVGQFSEAKNQIREKQSDYYHVAFSSGKHLTPDKYIFVGKNFRPILTCSSALKCFGVFAAISSTAFMITTLALKGP